MVESLFKWVSERSLGLGPVNFPWGHLPGALFSCLIPLNDFVHLLLASQFSNGNIWGKVRNTSSKMRVGQDYGSLWFWTETLGHEPTGFRVIVDVVPAVTWRKDKKHMVSIVSPWPSSSGLGEIAPSQLPDPSDYPLHKPNPVTSPYHHELLPNWSKTCFHLQSPGCQEGLFIFKMTAAAHWTFVISLLFVHSIPLTIFAIQWGRSPSIPSYRGQIRSLRTCQQVAELGPCQVSLTEWQQYLCPMYLVSSVWNIYSLSDYRNMLM